MKKILLYLACFIGIIVAATVCVCAATPLIHRTEAFYQEKFAKEVGGTREVVLDDGTRIDIATQTEAIEVEFAHKFYEAIGQSLHYAVKTGKNPVIWLIVENQGEEKYVQRCVELIKYIYLERGERKQQIKVLVYRAYR